MLLSGQQLRTWAEDKAQAWIMANVPMSVEQRGLLSSKQITIPQLFPNIYQKMTQLVIDSYSHGAFQRIEAAPDDEPLMSKNQMNAFLNFILPKKGIKVVINKNDLEKWKNSQNGHSKKIILPGNKK